MKKIIKLVHAHCDGPCGHYETDTLKNAAITCLKIVNKILALNSEDKNNYVRYIILKEKHAQLCKEQIYILWSDFFKAKHYQEYSNLHNQLYLIAQQSSLVKYNVDAKIAEELIKQIEVLDEIFIKVSKS